MIIIADASAVASFLLPDEAGVFADLARDVCLTNDVRVPQHWPVEMANILWKAQRRKRLAADDLAAVRVATANLAQTMTVEPEAPIDQLLSVAIRHDLSAYDASYLLLALSRSAQLLTRGGALSRAALAEGITVLAP